MNLLNARRLIEDLPEKAIVVDVGGGASPFPRADYIIDALPFSSRGNGSDQNIHSQLDYPARYSAENWIQLDLCQRQPWPVEDKRFDFAVCSHLLEDIRDPIWVCSELQRIAKAGYIEVPSRWVEQSKGVENPKHAGYYHHRWLIESSENRLLFRQKPHLLHSINDAVVASLWPTQQIHPDFSILVFRWEGSFEAVEILEFDEGKVGAELCLFASKSRQIRGLVTSRKMTFGRKLRKYIYYWRQYCGRR